MANSADPDQLATSEANWSGSILFAKAGYIRGSVEQGLTFTTLWANSAEDNLKYFCQKTGTDILRRQFAWNVKAYFELLSAETIIQLYCSSFQMTNQF